MATFPGGGNGTVTYDPDTGTFYNNGVQISPTFTVADWTALNAIPKTAANDNLLVFVTGFGESGSLWRYNHSITRWVLPSPIMLYDKVFGIKGAGTLQVTSDGSNVKTFVPASIPTIPANMLRAGSTLEIEAQVGRVSGLNDATAALIYMGKSTTSTANPAVASSGLTKAASHVANLNPLLSFGSTTKLTTTYSVNPNGGSSSTSIQDFTTNIDVTADMYVHVAVNTSLSGDVFELLRLAVKVNTA